jgi:hypothetical protein
MSDSHCTHDRTRQIKYRVTGDDHPHGKLAAMTEYDPKADLRRYLQRARDALLWKLEGLSEYDIRRPMTPTGTNLLGLVKHAAATELGYFGEVFGRPSDMASPLDDEEDVNGDLYAKPEESREDIIEFYRRVQAHANDDRRARPGLTRARALVGR